MFGYDTSIKKELDTRWQESQPLWQQYWYEADMDTKLVTGQQDYLNAFYNVNYRNQKILMFNKLLRIRNLITGYQRKNRLSTVYQAGDSGSDQIADEYTKVSMWVHNQADIYEAYSECFDGAVIQGLSLLNLWMDYREDPENGNIKATKIPFNAFLMDNYWTQQDLSDCDWIWTRKYLTNPQLLSLYPKIKKDLPTLSKGYGIKDGRFQFLAQNWYQYQQELYSYDEYWKRDYRKVRKILDKATGELIEWNGTRDQFQLLRRFNPNVELITAMKPTVKLHVLVNNNLIYEESQPYGIDSYPFVPSLGYHFTEVQNYAYRYQGVIRNCRDSQLELNRRRNRMLDILDAQAQSGLMVKEDALVNPEDAFKQGPGQVMFFKQSSNLQSDVVPIPPPQIPPSIFELQKVLEEEIMEIAGVTQELFGENDNSKDVSGLLHKLRVGASLVSLQGIMDNCNRMQKNAGRIIGELFQANFGEGKIQDILGKKASPEFFSKDFIKYHITVEEGMLTDSQRQMQFAQALQLREMGIPIPTSYLLEKSTLSGKKELIAAIEQEEQGMAQMQQQQAQAEIQQQQMLARSLEAKAQSDYASAIEHKTRAVSNLGLAEQKSAQALHDQAKTALDNAKALVELQGIPQERLLKTAEFVLKMQEQEQNLHLAHSEQAIRREEMLASSIQQSEQKTA